MNTLVVPNTFSESGRCALVIVLDNLFGIVKPYIMHPNQAAGNRIQKEYFDFMNYLGISQQTVDRISQTEWQVYAINGGIDCRNILKDELHTNSEKSFVYNSIQKWMRLINDYASNDPVFVATAKSIADRDILDSIINW